MRAALHTTSQGEGWLGWDLSNDRDQARHARDDRRAQLEVGVASHRALGAARIAQDGSDVELAEYEEDVADLIE